MASILILEPDPMLSAALEDRLHVAGHQAEPVTNPSKALALLAESAFDLFILSMELPAISGIEVVEKVRGDFKTRALPILALSTRNHGAVRVAALRAGVDEYLTKPVHFEELEIRTERMLGHRDAAPTVMRGDLSKQPTWEVMQYLQQLGKGGEFVVRGPLVSGSVQVENGLVVSAEFKELRGRTALMAILDQKAGNFRLTTEDGELSGEIPEGAFPIPEVLMHAAWFEDEIEKRKKHLPVTGVSLAAVKPPPEIQDEDLAEVPIPAIYERIVQQNGVRLYDLMEESGEAPQAVRLAVAWLVEQGCVTPDAENRAVMTTTEISSSMVLDVALNNLLAAAKVAGFDPSNLPYLLLVEQEILADLKKVLTSVPGFQHIEPLRKLVDQLELRQGGSAIFEAEQGKLALHAQVITSDVKGQMESILPVCAGALLWLGSAGNKDLLQGFIRRLGFGATGIIIADEDTRRAEAETLITVGGPWRVSSHAPQSFIGILRLLHPASRAG